MVGIKSYGVCVPFYRLKRMDINNTWQTSPFHIRGERTIANFDEDSLTMAVAAGMDCLTDIDRSVVDGIFCASTTYPYKEKLSSANGSADASHTQKSTLFALSNTAGNSLRSNTIPVRLLG